VRDPGVLDRAGDSVGTYLPRLGAALAVVVLGVLVALVLGRVVRRVLEAAGFDEIAARHHLDDLLARLGLGRSLAALAGRATRLAVLVLTVVVAISTLGLQALEESLNAAVLFLPRLFVAAVIILLGVVAGRLVRDRVDRLATQMDLAGPLGTVAEVLVVAVFAGTALAELGVPVALVTLFAAIVVGTAGLGVALAVGLGSRDVARQVSAGRTLRDTFGVGQRIRVGDVHGEIRSLGSSAVLVRQEDGRLVRLPNSMLLESVVVHDAPPEQSSSSSG
jgi:hypothetical protein